VGSLQGDPSETALELTRRKNSEPPNSIVKSS
jgi:hypothetical protein